MVRAPVLGLVALVASSTTTESLRFEIKLDAFREVASVTLSFFQKSNLRKNLTIGSD